MAAGHKKSPKTDLWVIDSLMQGPNLLQNPSFEQGTQDGWSPWHRENTIVEPGKRRDPDLHLSFYAPDFGLSEHKWDKKAAAKQTKARRGQWISLGCD